MKTMRPLKITAPWKIRPTRIMTRSNWATWSSDWRVWPWQEGLCRDHSVEEAAKKGKPELEKAIEFLRGKIAEAVADGASSAEVEELKSKLKEAIKTDHARIFEENQ